MNPDPRNSWHVRQQFALRRWKPPRADLRNYRAYTIRTLMGQAYGLARLTRAIGEGVGGVFTTGKRISAPIELYKSWPLRLKSRIRRRPKHPAS